MAKDRDSIRKLLASIKALMNDPNAPTGERDAAAAKLEALLQKYDLCVEDLENEVAESFVIQTKNELEVWLATQIGAFVTGDPDYSRWRKPGARRVTFKARPSQTKEILDLWKFLRPILRQEYDKFMGEFRSAFANKYDIALPSSGESCAAEWTQDDWDRYKRHKMLVAAMIDVALPSPKKFQLKSGE